MSESESISSLLDACLILSKLFSNRFLTASRAKILMQVQEELQPKVPISLEIEDHNFLGR